MIRCVGGSCSRTARWAGHSNGPCAIRWGSQLSTTKGWIQSAVRADDSTPAPASTSEAANTLKTVRSNQLPLSPLMDPSFLAAREQHRRPKPRLRREDMGEFQKALAKNPYARALATPVRRCKLTQVVLPNFFLQDVNTIEDPKTGIPWILPRSLTSNWREFDTINLTEELERRCSENNWNENSIDKGPIDVEEFGVVSNLAATSESQPDLAKAPLHTYTPSIGVTAYALSSYNLIDDFSGPNRKFSGKNGKSRRNKSSPQASMFWKTARNVRFPSYIKAASKIEWRPDMSDFILELMRRRIAEGIIHCFNKKRGYLTSFDNGKPMKMAGAALYLGIASKEETPIGDYHILSGIPIYDMRELLGEEKIQWLKEKTSRVDGPHNPASGLFDNEVVLLRNKNMTVELQMRLWKLHGYLAEHLPETVGGPGAMAPKNEL